MNQTGVFLNNQLFKTTALPNDNIKFNKKNQDQPFLKMLQNEKSLEQTEKTEAQMDGIQDEGLEVDDTLRFLDIEELEEIEGAFELLNMLITNNQDALSALEFIQQLLGGNPSDVIKDALGYLMILQDTDNVIDFTQLPPAKEDINALNGILKNGLEKSLQGLNSEQKNALLTLLNFGKLIVLSYEHVSNQKEIEDIDQLDALLLKWKDKLTILNETKQAITTDIKNNAILKSSFGMNTFNLQSRTDALNLKNGGSFVATTPVPAKSADIPLNQTVMIGDLQLQTQQQSPVLALEKGGQAVGADEFMKSFESILSKANYTNQNGIQRLFVRLTPENLGTLQIELLQKDGQLVAKIIANTHKGKELLESQIQGLRVVLASQGIDFDKIDLEQAQDAHYQEESSQDKRSDDNGQQTESNRSGQEEESSSGFLSIFEDSMINQEI